MSGETQTSSIRDSLNAAVEKVEKTNAPETTSGDSGSTGSVVSGDVAADLAGDKRASDGQGAEGSDGSTAGRVRGPDGKFAKSAATAGTAAPKVEAKAATKAPVVEATTETKAPPVAATATTPAPVAAVTTPTLKAPQSWKADVREQFAALPPAVQAEVLRRETEIAQTLQGASEPRKFHESFKQAVAPYQQAFASRGMDSLKAVTDLLPTALALHTGSVQQKAQTIAQACQAFGIPVEELARALDGRPSAQAQQPQNIDPRVIAQQVRDEMRQEQEQTHRMSAAQEFLKAEPEFLNDVGPVMEGVIQAAIARGESPSTKLLQDAYDQACWANPQVRAVIQQREAAKAANASVAASQAARNASVSVRTTTAAPVASAPKSRREALEEAASKVR